MKPEKKDLTRVIREERLERQGDPMWFYDEPEELWTEFRREAAQIEREYLELRTALRDAKAALLASPGDPGGKARVEYLGKRLSDLEKLAPWLSLETPVEVLLWGVPHG